jgi:hypothetical protein
MCFHIYCVDWLRNLVLYFREYPFTRLLADIGDNGRNSPLTSPL